MIKPLAPSKDGQQLQLGEFANHAHHSVRFMWERIVDQRVSLKSVSRASGIDSSSLHKWRKSVKGPTVQQLDDVLHVLGYEIVIQRKVDFGE